MYLTNGQWATLFEGLFRIDVELNDQCRGQGCPLCGGPLHRANYQRKPRGGPEGLGEEVCRRMSLCCGRGECRRRTMPPSCRFLGRKVYWGAVIVVVTAVRQRRPWSASAGQLRAAFGVSWETVRRWMTYFQKVFPLSSTWKTLRGWVPSTVRDHDLPAGLLELLSQQDTDPAVGLTHCLRLLSGAGCESRSVRG